MQLLKGTHSIPITIETTCYTVTATKLSMSKANAQEY